MKFIYGKQDFKTIERGEENCYLLTNGLGGFSSGTMAGSNTRNDHAFLMACTKAPNHRINMVHRLSERLKVGEKTYYLSSQEFTDGKREDGYRYLVEFSFEDTPQWRYQVDGVEIIKSIGMAEQENTVGVVYEIRNFSHQDCCLEVTPFYQFVPKGEDLKKTQEFVLGESNLLSGEKKLSFHTNGNKKEIHPQWEQYHYSYDACDGRREAGTAYGCHTFWKEAKKESLEQLDLVFTMEGNTKSAGVLVEEGKALRRAISKRADFKNPVAQTLAKSAWQFISKRESTMGETILAGYPFFEDWGRDTMIALPGCALSTGQYEIAKSILRTFMENEKKGLMPNLFPEGGNEPAYNTVDAALLFINGVYLYYEKTGDMDFVKEAYPVMERIIKGYQEGTDFGIHMDKDGLIMAGQGLDQVTWMDVRVGEILPTPRHGKPVEINAYWYNALRILDKFGAALGKKTPYLAMADQAKESFVRLFWREEESCLRDVISQTKADEQIRCNQIWAVSLPFTMLAGEQEKQVVQRVFERLYTPYGLRTLDPKDGEFQGFYGGEQIKRDLAYHQGTVWPFPLGAYYLAYLKVNGYSQEAKNVVTEQLEVMESALREGCIGQLPEIYDGENPTSSKGCFAQAWSVGEILRVYEVLESETEKE